MTTDCLSFQTSSNDTGTSLPLTNFVSLPSAASFNKRKVSVSCSILASISSLVVPMLYLEQKALIAPDTTP